jgi:hypothetical protein
MSRISATHGRERLRRLNGLEGEPESIDPSVPDGLPDRVAPSELTGSPN